MANTNHGTPAITSQAKRAIELYLHGLAVYAAYPERRTADQMYEIRRVSETFSQADQIAYNSNESQRRWWITAHNAFCDVTSRPSEAILPTFDEELGFALHAIDHPHDSVLQDRASHRQLDQLPKILIEEEGDVFAECKNSEIEGFTAVTAFVPRRHHQSSVEASTENDHGAEDAFVQPLQETTAELSKGIENLSFASSSKKLEHTGKNILGSGEVGESHKKAKRSTRTGHPSLDGLLIGMSKGSTFKELNNAKSELKSHLDAAVDLCIAARDGLNLQGILNEHMKRTLLETDPDISSHKLQECVRHVAFVLDETKARFHETSTALLYAQMERESLDRKIEFAQSDLLEQREKRKEAAFLLANAVDRAEKTMLEKHQLKKELTVLRAKLAGNTAQ